MQTLYFHPVVSSSFFLSFFSSPNLSRHRLDVYHTSTRGWHVRGDKKSVTQLTEHLNSVDSIGSIQFMCEEETEGQISFLDTLFTRKEDGNTKLLVYRKKTHADQYLNFMSHHPLHQKLGVIRTLLNRCENVVTEEEDRRQEEEHITSASKQCGYPAWSIRKTQKTYKFPTA